MITTRAMPAPLPAHHRRVASQATVKNDFADPLGHPWLDPAVTGDPAHMPARQAVAVDGKERKWRTTDFG